MNAEKINTGMTRLGLELGSTRIKACLIDDTYSPIASGSYEWSNRLIDGYWTYSLEEIHTGLRECYSSLRKDVAERYGVPLKRIGAVGISGMMHGYLAFDKDDRLLVPFRTWRNTTTQAAADRLTELFGFNIPQRWSIAHLYQAILNEEPHVPQIAHLTTLSGYIHYRLTGEWVMGACECSGMFPLSGKTYDREKIRLFEELIAEKHFPWKLSDILPQVKLCGETAGHLSKSGAAFLDETGMLESGSFMCPPEGDMGTGMVATDSVKPKTGNVSAGTSVNSLFVLEKDLKGLYREIDVVTTPDAHPVAMVHSNNGCSELDEWVNMFFEFARKLGANVSKSDIYQMLYENALTADADCGGAVSYNFLANEPIFGVTDAAPLCFRQPQGAVNLANFFRSELYATMTVLKAGMDLLENEEQIHVEIIRAHGGLFKVPRVAQQLLADALNTSVSVAETAGDGGAWGMALLAAYGAEKTSLSLGDWLDENVFGHTMQTVLSPRAEGVEGFAHYYSLYRKGLSAYKNFEF